ncbi:MAG: hypothetical protein ACJ75G_07675 [Gaiellaceae bacterium]
MATEAEIRQAERARLKAVVDERGTERERLELVFSGLMRHGFTVAQWCGEEPVGDVTPDPELLARLARRAECRSEFGLPAVECAGEPATHGCKCLELALDEAGGRGGKRAVLRLAAGFHWCPPPRRERVAPQEASPEPQKATERVAKASPQPKATPKPEPPFRVVKHFPRWYDDAERPRFSDMTF